MGIWEPRAIGCDVAVVTGRWGPLRDKLVAESGGAMNEGRTLHVFRAITLVSRHAVADPPSTDTARDARTPTDICIYGEGRRRRQDCRTDPGAAAPCQPPIAVAGSLRRLPTPPADSPSLAGFLFAVSKSRQLPRGARARPGGRPAETRRARQHHAKLPVVSLSGAIPVPQCRLAVRDRGCTGAPREVGLAM